MLPPETGDSDSGGPDGTGEGDSRPRGTVRIRVRHDDSHPEESGYAFVESPGRRVGRLQWSLQTGLRNPPADDRAANRVIAETTINGSRVVMVVDSDDARLLLHEDWLNASVLAAVDGIAGCDGMVGLHHSSARDIGVPLPTGFRVIAADPGSGVVRLERPATGEDGSHAVRMLAAVVGTSPGDDLDAALALLEPRLQKAGMQRTAGRLLEGFTVHGRELVAFAASGRIGDAGSRAFAAVWILDADAQELLLVLVDAVADSIGEWQVRLLEALAPGVWWPAASPPEVTSAELSGEYLSVDGRIEAAQLNIVLLDADRRPVSFDGRPWKLQWWLRSQRDGDLDQSPELLCSSSADGLATGRHAHSLRLPLGEIVNRAEGARLHVDVQITVGDVTIPVDREVDKLFGR